MVFPDCSVAIMFRKGHKVSTFADVTLYILALDTGLLKTASAADDPSVSVSCLSACNMPDDECDHNNEVQGFCACVYFIYVCLKCRTIIVIRGKKSKALERT